MILKTRTLLIVAGCAALWAAGAPAAPPDLMAHASPGASGDLWIAQVRQINDNYRPAFGETDVWDRSINGSDWVSIDPIDQRVVSLGNLGSELALLREDGDWFISDPGSDSRLG